MRRAVVLGAVAVGGTVAFTVTWVLLGWSHAGYRPRAETISSLSAHDAVGWPVMVLAQLTLAAAFASVSALAVLAHGRRGRVVAALLGLACLGTLQLSTFRTVCNHMDAGWCTPLPRSAYPHQQWLHGWGTALAFVM